ncbi:unnamed protein product, partial [Heligmosomoides polygyrus]|uniref:EB domain-containing protein n=1 Tax=Heligmosomoides polygyrus TaxID=6339 RepID=A0A183FB64_HELPZ
VADVNGRCGYHDGYPKCSNGFVCTNQVCRCPSLNSSDGETCSSNTTLQHVTPFCGQACEAPRLCVNNQCVCVDGVSCPTLNVSRRRRRRAEQSMVCWPGAAQCSAGNGVCIENVCHCINGFVEADGVCAPEVVGFNDKCDPNNVSPRCAENSICSNGICVCATHDGCDRVTAMSGPRFDDGRCTSDAQCQDGRCSAGRCQCGNGFTLQVLNQWFAQIFQLVGSLCEFFSFIYLWKSGWGFVVT